MPEMKFDTIEDVKIPQAFTYICSASGFNDVNLIPLYHFAKGRIKKLVIQVGVTDVNAPNANEAAHANRPASWLISFANHKFGLQQEDIHLVAGGPDEISVWQDGVTWAEQFDLPILANLQGGTTQMSIGASEALMRSNNDFMRLFIGKAPAVTLAAVLIGNRQEIVAIPLTDETEWVPLDVALDARDLERVLPSDPDKEQVLGENAELAKNMLGRFCRVNPHKEFGRRRGGLIALNREIAKFEKMNQEQQRSTPLDLGDKTKITDALGETICQHALWSNGQLTTKAQRGFFSGDWFEQAMFDLIKEKFPPSKDFELWLNVHIGRMGVAQPDPMNEIDIFIKKRNILNLLEVKTAATPATIKESIDKLSSVRSAIASNLARAWLCVPMYSDTPFGAEEISGRAAKKGVTLLMGPNAVGDLLKEIARLP